MRRTAFVALLATAAATQLPCQDPPTPEQLTARFARLTQQRQQQVLDAAERSLREGAGELGRAIAQLADQARAAPALAARTFHDPAEFAPVAPRRSLVPTSDPRHQRVRSDFPKVRILRDLACGVVYDWLDGGPARLPSPPAVALRFANLANGYMPDSDAAIAAVLVELDRDADQRTLARWCEQLYADRDGKVFAEITLYEAWLSGRTVEVPDVDAIAFARRILCTDSHQSPIPEGPRRDRLYAQIRAALKKHREYRTLCEAAAAAFVTASPELDPTYQPLVDRMHLLFGECGDDLQAFAARLTAQDRGELIAELDRSLDTGAGAQAQREGQRRRQDLRDAARRACDEALQKAGG